MTPLELHIAKITGRPVYAKWALVAPDEHRYKPLTIQWVRNPFCLTHNESGFPYTYDVGSLVFTEPEIEDLPF